MNTLRFLIALIVILCLVLSSVIALMPANTAWAQPADSDWPMFRQNPQHTSRSPYGPPAFAVPLMKWFFPIGLDLRSSPTIGPDGTIYIGGYDNLLAINPDGSLKWNFAFHIQYTVISSPAIGVDGTIYVGALDGKLYAIDPDGTEKWSFATLSPLSYGVRSSPTIGPDGTIYVGSCDGKLYAVRPDGTESWNFTTNSYIESSPAIGANDGTIYVGAGFGWPSKKFFAINPDGTEKWSFTPYYAAELTTPAVGVDGTIYFGSASKYLYALNPDGSFNWTFNTPQTLTEWVSTPAIGADGTIYVSVGYWPGIVDKNFYAINPDGTEKWSLTAEDVFTGASIGADGTIYVGSEDNNLYALNPDGSQRWSFTTGGVVCTCPAIGADGTIYVGSEDHNLYAITGLYTLTIPFPEPIDPTAPFPLPCSGSSITDPGYGTFTYGPGTVVDLIAEAEEGCYFAEWIGDVGTIDNVYAAETTITMDGNYIVAAHFEELPAPSPFPAPGGCFIATAAYGTPIAEEVEILREFRDEYLLTNSVGQALVDFYYKVSPPMADFIAEHPGLKPIVRAGLVPAVAMATLAVNTTRVEKAAIVGLVALLPAATAVLMARRRNRGREYT